MPLTETEAEYLAFLRAWRDDELPNKSMRRAFGLCFNIRHNGPVEHSPELSEALEDLQDQFFNALALDVVYPFGEDNYKTRRDAGTIDLDPARIAFVHQTIATLEKKEAQL